MVNQALVNYIRNAVQQGYDINTVRNLLYQQRYPLKDIDEAIQAVYQPPVKHVVSLSKGTLAVFAVLIIGIVAVSAFFLLKEKPSVAPPRLLDLRLEIVGPTTLNPGDELVFLRHLASVGAAARYDVSITYEISDPSGRVIASQTETAAIETAMSAEVKIRIPDDAASGGYTLRASGIYDTQRIESSFTFKIIGVAAEPGVPLEEVPLEPAPECPASCDDANICTRDLCSEQTGYRCLNEPVSPCCGNRRCETGESFETCPGDCIDVSQLDIEIPADRELTPGDLIVEADKKAASDPNSAARICDQIGIEEGSRDFDRCYTKVAKNSKQSGFCSYIQGTARKDNCYMSFAMDNDFSVCPEIEDQYLSQTCDSLKIINELAPVESGTELETQ